MSHDPHLRAHREWLGLLQPVGLVVSAPALAAAQAVVNKNVVDLQQRLLSVVDRDEATGASRIDDFPAFTRDVLGWEPSDLAGAAGGPPIPETLAVSLPDYGIVLEPTYAVPDPDTADSWLMLVVATEMGVNLDEAGEDTGRGWHASPQAKLERLLRER